MKHKNKYSSLNKDAKYNLSIHIELDRIKIQGDKMNKEEKVKKDFYRVAWLIEDLHKSERGIHTRLFDLLISDEDITIDESIKGRGHREHIVPCVVIVDEAIRMYDEENASVEQVANMMQSNLKIVHITKEEQKKVDYELKLQRKMPNGWKFGDSIFERLKKADIKLEKHNF